MRRESTKVEESSTSPKLTKGPPVRVVVRRMWEPGAGGRRPGGSESAWMTQGLRTYQRLAAVLRRLQNIVERLIRTSWRPRGWNKTTRVEPGACVGFQRWPDLWLKTPRSNPDKADAERRRWRDPAPTRLVWGPGAGVEAAGRLCPRHKRAGVASRPELAAKVSWRKSIMDKTSGPRRCVGVREEEWDVVGTGESQGKRHLAQACERSSAVTRRNDGSWVPGTSDGAPGGSDPPNESGVASRP